MSLATINAINPRDERLVDDNELVDARVALHGRAVGVSAWNGRTD